MQKLALKVGFIIFIAFLCSFGIDSVYRHIYHLSYELPKNIFILPEIKEKYGIVKLGNSHAEDGIDFSRYAVKSLSLASVGQPFEYDLAYLKMHSRQIKQGAVILINVSPLSFSQKKAGKEDSLQTNYYDGRISPFLIPNINVGDYLQSRIFPFLRAGYLLRQKNTDAIQARISKEEKWPEPTPLTSGTVNQDTGLVQNVTQNNAVHVAQNKILNVKPEDYYYNVEAIQDELATPSAVPRNKLVDSMQFMVNKWYTIDEFSPQYFDSNRKDLEKIVEYCLKMKWRPVLITVPISQVLLNGLKPDYMKVYVYDNVAKINLHGTEYFDFTKNIQLIKDSYLFSNSDHLGKNGAAVLSYLLLRRLIDRGYLSKEADRYDYGPLWISQD